MLKDLNPELISLPKVYHFASSIINIILTLSAMAQLVKCSNNDTKTGGSHTIAFYFPQ